MTQGSVLLAGSTEKGRALLQALIPGGSFESVHVCQSGGEVRRAMVTADPALIVINTPLSDESGLELAMELAHQSIAGVLLLVKAEMAETVADRVEDCGVTVLAKPVARPLLDQALRFTLAARKRMLLLQAEYRRLQQKLDEVRLTDRAKCVLIQYLGMTEDQAHRQIEKQAMDTRQTKAAVAREILSTYEM